MTSSPPSLNDHQINTTAVSDGKSMTTATSTPTPWSSESNWTVSRGSLDSAVTFESFDFPIDSESTGPKPPLLLVPSSSSNFEPCEIKLNFSQKHEIRQVYVRSTARVYEIYYTPDLKSEIEYLCTVRCSSVEENVSPETGVKEASSVNLEGQNEILPKGRVAGGNNVGTNEDDWVEIKLPVGRVDEGNTTSNRNYYQNYYEATAEINDSDPCISLTLRLLSLQTKTCVYIDEVYVFADPIDLEDSKNPTVIPEASGSSLMTMLVPTLLGLSKSKSLQLPDYQPTSKTVQEPVKTEPTQSHVETDKRDQSLLEQLVSRVSRIENMLLRFEENILKPVNVIESRLERVEHQVELLAKKFPVLPSDPKFPENSNQLCGESESESEKQDLKARSELKYPENSNQLCGESESEEQGPKAVIPVLPSDPKNPENSNQLCGESESENPEEKDVLEPEKNEKTKKHVSIDDALAAALAGFSSFTKPKEDFPIIPLESPEEPCLKDTSLDETSVSSESPKAIAIEEENNGGTTCENDNSTPDKTADEIVKQDSTEAVKVLTFDKNEILKYFPNESRDTNSCENDDSTPDKTEGEIVKQDSTEAVKVLTFDKNEILKYFPNESQDTNLCENDDSTPDKTEGGIVKEAVKVLTFDKNDILKYFPDESRDTSCGFESGLDFETPVLEVKFASLENGSLKSHLQDFLVYTDEDETKTNTTANGLLDLDGDYVTEEGVQQETSFESLI